MWRGLLCACFGTAWVTSAAAGSAADLRNDWSGEYAPNRNISITVAPLSLMDARAPSLDITAEVRAGESRSVAITSSMATARIGSFGNLADLADLGDRGTPDKAPPRIPSANRALGGDRELGLQVRDYVVGAFDNGLFLGGQASFTNPDVMRLRADRTRFGPMAGIKVSISLFTVEGRAGAWVDLGKQGMSVEPRVDFATGLTF